MASHGCQDQPVDRKKIGPLDLSPEHRDLVAQSEDLSRELVGGAQANCGDARHQADHGI